jgi:hypothetical protein
MSDISEQGNKKLLWLGICLPFIAIIILTVFTWVSILTIANPIYSPLLISSSGWNAKYGFQIKVENSHLDIRYVHPTKKRNYNDNARLAFYDLKTGALIQHTFDAPSKKNGQTSEVNIIVPEPFSKMEFYAPSDQAPDGYELEYIRNRANGLWQIFASNKHNKQYKYELRKSSKKILIPYDFKYNMRTFAWHKI